MLKSIKNLSELYWVHFAHFVFARFKQDRCLNMASSLTYTTLLSLVPLITIMFTFFTAFPQFTEYSGHAKNIILSNMLPETGGRIISHYMEQFSENAAKLTTVGIAFLAVTAMLLIYTIDNAFNTIWRVPRQRKLVQRMLVYWAVLTLAPILIGSSLSLTSWLIGMSVGNLDQLSGVMLLVLKIASLLLATLAFTFLFRVVPNRFVPLHHAFIGGVVSAIAFEAMNRSFALYIAYFPTYKLVYGAFASIPIFLLWIYLSWLTVLSGAVLTSSLSHWRSKNGIHPLSPEVRLYYALCILRILSDSMRSGQMPSLPKLSRELLLGYDSLEELLEKMVSINLVQCTVGNCWTMVRAPEHVLAVELYCLFVFDPSKPPVLAGCEGINDWLAKLAEQNSKIANVNLRTLFSEVTIAR